MQQSQTESKVQHNGCFPQRLLGPIPRVEQFSHPPVSSFLFQHSSHQQEPLDVSKLLSYNGNECGHRQPGQKEHCCLLGLTIDFKCLSVLLRLQYGPLNIYAAIFFKVTFYWSLFFCNGIALSLNSLRIMIVFKVNFVEGSAFQRRSPLST